MQLDKPSLSLDVRNNHVVSRSDMCHMDLESNASQLSLPDLHKGNLWPATQGQLLLELSHALGGIQNAVILSMMTELSRVRKFCIWC